MNSFLSNNCVFCLERGAPPPLTGSYPHVNDARSQAKLSSFRSICYSIRSAASVAQWRSTRTQAQSPPKAVHVAPGERAQDAALLVRLNQTADRRGAHVQSFLPALRLGSLVSVASSATKVKPGRPEIHSVLCANDALMDQQCSRLAVLQLALRFSWIWGTRGAWALGDVAGRAGCTGRTGGGKRYNYSHALPWIDLLRWGGECIITMLNKRPSWGGGFVRGGQLGSMSDALMPGSAQLQGKSWFAIKRRSCEAKHGVHA